jgi:hypothetical protein
MVAKISDFKMDILAKLMVLEYASTNLFKEIYNWQSLQKGEPKQIADLEKLAGEEKYEEIKKQFSVEWGSEKIIKWLNAEPKLTNVDLRDYYWISRDQLSTTISGASLIPPHIRSLTKKLIDHSSGSILTHTIAQEVNGKLNETEGGILLSLLQKELIKLPENDSIHKVFIEMMSQNVSGVIESYSSAISKTDNSKIPFSLRNEFALAEKKNDSIKSLYSQFTMGTDIYKALNPKK